MSAGATAPPPPAIADSLLAETGWQALVLHDLRAPLAVVVGQVQMLQRDVARGDHLDAALTRIDHILHSASQMVSMLDELQALASPRVPPPLRRQRADLLQVVHGVADEFADRAPKHVFRVLSSETSLVGRWDRGLLERALGNLFSNAVKYSPAGGEVAVLLWRECLVDGDWAAIGVRDRGLGIPSADLAHVFERFYRGGNVVGQIDGAGLGLASVHQVVEQHGGTVNVASRVGSGTTFTVRLPLYSQ
jgi:signal transduction histidine kinase